MYTMGMPIRSSKKKSRDSIIIDESNGLVFESEDDLYSHFQDEIHTLEREFFDLRRESDIPEEGFKDFDVHLDRLLDDPDEVWEDTETLTESRMFIYIRSFENGVNHVACCYLTEATPSFVYLHFPTSDENLVERYRRGQLVFQRSATDLLPGALEGDALHEGDQLAEGLYKAMLLLRSDKDIPEHEFHLHAGRREETLEEADEIWRSADSLGNVLVSFIKECSDEDEELYYIVVTVEDAPSGSHALLFSFPTRDKSLVGRYRHGENLQAEEVVQESSH
ncbi:MAG: PBECR2 nuclease fold domain-containing protein [Bdellovibrionales bacterium]